MNIDHIPLIDQESDIRIEANEGNTTLGSAYAKVKDETLWIDSISGLEITDAKVLARR